MKEKRIYGGEQVQALILDYLNIHPDKTRIELVEELSLTIRDVVLATKRLEKIKIVEGNKYG